MVCQLMINFLKENMKLIFYLHKTTRNDFLIDTIQIQNIN